MAGKTNSIEQRTQKQGIPFSINKVYGSQKFFLEYRLSYNPKYGKIS